MNITLFNKKYWIRRFGEQTIVRGLVKTTHTDFVASLHVHPTGSDQEQANPEGQRRIKHLEGHASVPLVVANEATSTKGDLLYYDGEWYECIGAQRWDHTILAHTNYQFVLSASDGVSSPDYLNPPTNDPEKCERCNA